MSLPDREDELLATLRAIEDAGFPYVLVGGWAVTAFEQRFSTDVDLVIPGAALSDVDALLADRGYERTADHDTGARYDGRFVEYAKDVGNPVAVDLMVNALRCRQTDAEWSFEYLDEHARPATIGRTIEVDTRIPERELFLAIKLHSARLTDVRDVVAAATDADFDRVETHLHRGDPAALADQLARVVEQLDDESFADAFKGEFQGGTVPEMEIERIRAFLADQGASGE